MRFHPMCSDCAENINCGYFHRSLVMETGYRELRSALSFLLFVFLSCWLCMAVTCLLRRSECSGRSVVRWSHSLCVEVDWHYLQGVIGVLQRTRGVQDALFRRHHCLVTAGDESCVAHGVRLVTCCLNTCPSNPLSRNVFTYASSLLIKKNVCT